MLLLKYGGKYNVGHTSDKQDYMWNIHNNLPDWNNLSFFRLWQYSIFFLALADLDEQATERCSLIIEQMKQAEGVTETMKADNQMLWVQSMNSIRNRAEEIIRQEMIYC